MNKKRIVNPRSRPRVIEGLASICPRSGRLRCDPIVGIDIGVIFAREFAVRLANLFCAGGALNAQNLVIVLFLHPEESGTANQACQSCTEA